MSTNNYTWLQAYVLRMLDDREIPVDYLESPDPASWIFLGNEKDFSTKTKRRVKNNPDWIKVHVNCGITARWFSISAKEFYDVDLPPFRPGSTSSTTEKEMEPRKIRIVSN